MLALFDMGVYTFYVWMSVFVVVMVLGSNVAAACYKQKAVIKEIKSEKQK